jgi:hypothetical protein
VPTAILRGHDTSGSGKTTGKSAAADVSATITHNNARLHFANGRTYEYVGNDASGNRIYRDTSPSDF